MFFPFRPRKNSATETKCAMYDGRKSMKRIEASVSFGPNVTTALKLSARYVTGDEVAEPKPPRAELGLGS